MVKSSASDRFLSIRGLSKSFKNSGARIDVLQKLNADIDTGETIAIVGASGIGKSTFLHILGTLDRIDEGTVLFHGKDVFSFDDRRLAKFRNETVGFVFQFHYLLPEFSALENAMMPALISGTDRLQSEASAEELLVRVGLKERLLHRVGELSGGEQQRVALARAIVRKPPLLLADEPTGNLDRKNSRQVHELLLELNEEFSMTMVVVTHNTELASIMSRSVTIIEGRMSEQKP